MELFLYFIAGMAIGLAVEITVSVVRLFQEGRDHA